MAWISADYSLVIDAKFPLGFIIFSGVNVQIAPLSDLPSLESAGTAWTSLYPDVNKYSNQ